MKKNIKTIIITIFLVGNLAPVHSWAHGSHHGVEPDIEIYEKILANLGQLSIESTNDKASLRASVRLSTVPFFKVGGAKVYIDNAFWRLSDEISRLYIQELQNACPSCQMPSVEELQGKVKELVASGWFSYKATKIKDAVMYRYAGQFISLGAKYGPASGALKIAGELVEDAMLIVFKMPGAHFLCEVITAIIATKSGAVLTAGRTFRMAKNFNRSRISLFVRTAVTSYYVKRALNKMKVEAPSFSINAEELKEFQSEHPDRKMTYRFTNRHRVKSFLTSLEKKIQRRQREIDRIHQTPESQRTRFQKAKLAQAQEDIAASINISKKVFNGSRYKRFLLLKKRNQKRSLGQFAENTSPILGHTNFWFFELKNEIFEPLTEREISQFKNKPLANLQNLLRDPISQEQFKGIESRQGQELLAGIFESLDQIGNKELKPSLRYLNFTSFEAFYTNVLPRIMDQIIEERIEDLDKSERGFKDLSRLQWKAGRLSYFTNLFVDLVRFSAFDKKNADPLLKYHIRDYALEVLKAFSGFSEFSNINSKEGIVAATEYLDKEILNLQTKQFWTEKTKVPHLIPEFVRLIPQRIGISKGISCEALY